jgi:two-component system, NarL family, sensor histidine kinase UhpB
MRKVFLIAICLFTMSHSGRSQQGGDTAEIEKVKAAFKVISRKPDSALAIAENGLAHAQHNGDKRLAANSYKTGGWAWLHKGDYDKAFSYLLQATDLFRQMHDDREIMSMYINMGMAYSMRSQFATGAKYLFMADSLTKTIHDPGVEAEVQRQMGILYRQQGQLEKSIPYFRKSMDMYRNLGDTLHYFDAMGSLCIVLENMSLPDSALALLNESQPLMIALRGNNYAKAMFQERYGDAWYAKKRYDRAMESYSDAFKQFSVNNNKADMAYESMNLGKTYTALKDFRNAENYLLISYRLNDSLKITNYAHDAAEQLANLYKAKGDWRMAYSWLEKRSALQDSMELRDENEKTAQFQAKYETEKKDEEISLLKKDQELNRAVVQRQRAVQYGIIILGALLLLVGVLAINRYKAANKARRLIEMEKMRNNIARDLHDDMGSTLSSINIISKVAMENQDEKIKLGEHLKKIHDNSGFILENMSDIVWTINPVNDTLEKIVFKMKEFAADILEPLNIQYNFAEAGQFHNTRLGLQIRKDLYLVFKEAVNNAAKYSRCTRVDIAVRNNDRVIEMEIRDNGDGFDREAVKNGNGLKNMEERATQLHGELSIVSKRGAGTVIKIRVRSHD